MADGMLALTWNNHSSTFCKTISSLRVLERYTDVTITCESKFYQVHKFVLATCSEYFEKIFQETPCKHPVIVLRDVSCDELEALLNYMYIGSVSVAQSDLSRLIKVAELFQIKGLAVPDDPPLKGSDSDTKETNIDSRERNNSHIRGKGQEGVRNKNNHSADFSSPNPKRVRSHEHVSRTSSRNSDRMEDPGTEQGLPYGVHVKEEVHDITDSESEEHDSMLEAPFMTKSEPEDMTQDDQSLLQEDSQLVPPYLGSSDSQDIPPDEQSLTQPVLGQQHFTDDLLSLPGPSDAQEWYSEGDASGGIGEQTPDMHSLDSSQQQAQRMALPIVTTQRWQDGSKTNVEALHCSLCSYATFIKKDLLKHMVVHTGEKPYHCTFCPAKFTQKSSMIRHTRLHTEEKPFACNLCPYQANRKMLLKQHMISRHKIQASVFF